LDGLVLLDEPLGCVQDLLGRRVLDLPGLCLGTELDDAVQNVFSASAVVYHRFKQVQRKRDVFA